MLQLRNTVSNGLSVSDDVCMVSVLPSPIPELKFVGFDVRLQLKAKNGLVSFNNEVRENVGKKVTSLYAGNYPKVLWPVFDVAFGMVIDKCFAAKLFLKGVYDRFVSHADTAPNLVAYMGGFRFAPDVNADISLTIKKTSSVSKFHDLSSVVDEKMANSVDTQTGQYRAKQAERPGVCREHVPSPKGKICSDLRRNTETPAEMIGGHDVGHNYRLHHGLTDCNTNYLFFRPHRDRNFVPIGGERQSVNQDAIVKLIGWAGNLTSSGPQFSGKLSA